MHEGTKSATTKVERLDRMAAHLRRRFDRGLQVMKLQQLSLNQNRSSAKEGAAENQDPSRDDSPRPGGEVNISPELSDEKPVRSPTDSDPVAPVSSGALALSDGGDHVDDNDDGKRDRERQSRRRSALKADRIRRRLGWNAINSMTAIRLKMLILVLGLVVTILLGHNQVRAGFFTFYFPNMLKPRGFGELTDMISSLDGQINETRDSFADAQYFWGQLQRLDSVQSAYPEQSACSEVFPLFRDLAIEYVHIDFDHYIKPYELFKQHLVEFRDKWYPGGLEAKAALPRIWEQQLLEHELRLKITWLEKLTNGEVYRDKREHLIEIWRNVRRGLDTSLPCIYLRYAYRQIAEDINQIALESNLAGMNNAMKLLQGAHGRVERFKESDNRIIEDIEEEMKKIKRFTIRSRTLA